MHFSQRIPSKNLNVNYNNKVVDKVASTKFLGLEIDQNLNWKSHVVKVCKKLSKSAYALHALSLKVSRKRFLPPTTV